MKRILCVLASLNMGGAETFMMKIFRNLQTDKKIDFIVSAEEGYYEKEILELGGKIYRIPLRTQHPVRAFMDLKKIVQDNHYDTVLKLCETPIGVIDLIAAKLGGAHNLCVRSCNANAEEVRIKRMVDAILRPLLNTVATVKIAPSDLAAEFTFGAKAVQRGEVVFLHNALDLKQFTFSQQDRERIRAKLGVENKLVIGHVGRFNQQKNHKFILKVFAELKKLAPNAVLLLVGKGELEAEIRSQIQNLGLEDSVRLLGVRDDVPKLLCAMDAFLFPSFYEGMPNTVIEAQTTGLPCVISDTITAEAAVTPLVQMLPLELSAAEWAQKVLDAAYMPVVERTSAAELMKQAEYDIETCVMKFERMFFRN